MEKKEYNFNEKEVEFYNGQELDVWQSPKYKESKDKAISMIKDEKYKLTTADFWILMNTNKQKTKMIYTGLIISHNGCLKINEAIDNKVNPKCFSLDKEGFNNSLVYTYIDDDTYEVGEYNIKNCQNAYPYAMAFKRCFDRVVLKKSKLAFSGIYSEVEAEEFKNSVEEEIQEIKTHQQLECELSKLIDEYKIDYDKLCELYKVDDIHKLTEKKLQHAIDNIDRFEREV